MKDERKIIPSSFVYGVGLAAGAGPDGDGDGATGDPVAGPSGSSGVMISGAGVSVGGSGMGMTLMAKPTAMLKITRTLMTHTAI
jgi:hypothetical protein